MKYTMIGLFNWLVLVYVIKTFITEKVFLPYIQSRTMKLNTFVCIDVYFTVVYSPIHIIVISVPGNILNLY